MKNLIREILKEEKLLLERKIATIQANLIINYLLKHASSHSVERKFRHTSEPGGAVVSDQEIRNLVERAKEEITFHIVAEQIQDSVRFIVSDKNSPHLNVVIEPKMKNSYDWILNVITLMYKENYAIGRDQLRIYV